MEIAVITVIALAGFLAFFFVLKRVLRMAIRLAVVGALLLALLAGALAWWWYSPLDWMSNANRNRNAASRTSRPAR